MGPSSVGSTCVSSNADPSGPLPTPTPKLPHSNIFRLGYFYPDDIRRKHLEGRALVRLTVADSGAVASAEFLRIEATPPVQSAMCGLLRKLKYDLSTPGFETADSRILVIEVRYCIDNCSRVPAYPGFEKTEISVTVSS